jgi:hypothetical protein
MGTHLRLTPTLALIGALALGGAPAARAQDTSAVRRDTGAVRSDTSGYQGYGADTLQRTAPTGADTGAKYNGPPTDTTLKAKPGVQTGPSATDSSKKTGTTSQADTVVCKDGSTSARTGNVCMQHGGIDWTATNAALKARGQAPIQPGDSASTGTSTRYNGPPTDTTLKAKPGVQTGPTDSSSMGQMGDSSSMGQMKDTSSSSR